jgi:hypothetical protein
MIRVSSKIHEARHASACSVVIITYHHLASRRD